MASLAHSLLQDAARCQPRPSALANDHPSPNLAAPPGRKASQTSGELKPWPEQHCPPSLQSICGHGGPGERVGNSYSGCLRPPEVGAGVLHNWERTFRWLDPIRTHQDLGRPGVRTLGQKPCMSSLSPAVGRARLGLSWPLAAPP